MWPTWNERSTLVISRGVVAFAQPGLSRASQPRRDYRGFEEALDALVSLRWPPRRRFVTRHLAVWLDDEWTRMFGETWPGSIASIDGYRAFVAARFAQRFDLQPDEWRIVTPEAWPGRTTLCVAAPNELLDRLRSVSILAEFALKQVAPLSLAEVAAALPRRPRKPALFVGSVAARRTAFLLQAGRFADCVVLPRNERFESIAESVFRASGVLDTDLRWTLRLDVPRNEATAMLLDGRPLPLTRVEHSRVPVEPTLARV